MNWPRLCSRVPTYPGARWSSHCAVTVGWYLSPISPDRRGWATPRQYALPLRSLKLPSPWELGNWAVTMMDSTFSHCTFWVFFFMIFPLLRSRSRNILDGSGSDSSSRQNVPMALAPTPAPAKMCQLQWLRLWLRLRIPAFHCRISLPRLFWQQPIAVSLYGQNSAHSELILAELFFKHAPHSLPNWIVFCKSIRYRTKKHNFS